MDRGRARRVRPGTVDSVGSWREPLARPGSVESVPDMSERPDTAESPRRRHRKIAESHGAFDCSVQRGSSEAHSANNVDQKAVNNVDKTPQITACVMACRDGLQRLVARTLWIRRRHFKIAEGSREPRSGAQVLGRHADLAAESCAWRRRAPPGHRRGGRVPPPGGG